MTGLLSLSIGLVLLLVPGAAPARAAPRTITAGFSLADYRLADLDGDGIEDLILVGQDGRVRVWQGGEKLSGPEGDLVLPDPERSLLCLGDVTGDGKIDLAVLSKRGLTVYPRGKDGGFAGKGIPVAPGASFRLRVGSPVFAPILKDINGDGRLDLLVPGTGKRIPEDARACQIWMNRGAAKGRAGVPSFQLVASVRSVLHADRTTTGRGVSDRFISSFRIPTLDFMDVNGDGRKDLVVVDGNRRAFYLQKPDGTIPGKPDVVLDLGIFRDTTARATIRPGRILAGGDDPQLTISDLNGDGIPDYLIAHRRKIWIFLGSRSGPQFTKPDSILRVSEDVTALLVLPLDGDRRPDLLILRLTVPSIASIVSGLLTELEVEISAVGYSSGEKGRIFSEKPKWKGSLTIVLPNVIGILRNPGKLLGKLTKTESTFRRAAFGDFDGDGTKDVALLSEDGKSVDVFHLAPGAASESGGSGLSDLFFGKGKRSLDLGEVLDWLADMARERVKRMTGGEKPDRSFPVRDPKRYHLVGFTAGNVTGKARASVVLVYRDTKKDGAGIVDLR